MSNAPFPPFTIPLGRLHPEGMSPFHFISFLFFFFLFFFSFYIFSNLQSSNPIFFTNATVAHTLLNKFYLDRIYQVRTFLGRSFHSLVTLSRLAAWGLGLVPIAKNRSHKETTLRSKYRLFFSFFFFFFF